MKHTAVTRALATGAVALSCSSATTAEKWEAGEIVNRACQVPVRSTHEVVITHTFTIFEVDGWPQDIVPVEGPPLLDQLRSCEIAEIHYSARYDLPRGEQKAAELQKLLAELRPVTSPPAFRSVSDCFPKLTAWAEHRKPDIGFVVQVGTAPTVCSGWFEDGTELRFRRVTVAPEPITQDEQSLSLR